VRGPTFRVKPYAHPKYKFVVRAKLAGKWKRSYFKTEAEAVAYADSQNASLEQQVKQQRSAPQRSDGHTNGTRNWHELEKSNRRSTVSSQAVSRRAIVVLGMHRSGTSALCGALDLLGVNFGKHLMPANEANPKGYWEHPEIVALHDELLRSLGSRWDDDRPLPPDWVERDITRDIRSLLIRVLERDFAHASLLGLKDPRMCRLMPLWFPLFEKLGIKPYFVLVVRHPSEVAQSLAKRDGIDHALSYLLWLQHTLDAETVMRRHKRSFVDYDEMLDDPVAALRRVRSELKLDFRVPSRARGSLRKFLEPSLRHHKARARKCEKGADRVPPLIIEVYETIRKGTTPDDVARRISPLREQLARSEGLFYPRLNVLEKQVESLDQRVEKSAENAPRAEELVRLDIFRAVGEEYSAAHSYARYFTSGSWKLLQIDLPCLPRPRCKPLRIDPVSYPAIIDIAEIALKRPSTGEILWAAAGSREFAALTVGGTACHLAHESYLRILSFGNDPQLLLPQSTTALGDAPLRLELSILVDPSPEAIKTSLAEMQSAIHRSEEELKQLKTSIQSERIQLAAKRSQTAELTDKLVKLDQNVKNFTEVFGLTRQGLQDSGSAAAIFVQSLFRDIRQVRKRKFLWKACRLSRSMLSREGTQDIPSNPKVTAEVLKRRLQGIQRTLKSKKTSPAMALNAMAELIALQNQVHRVLASLRVGSLLRLQQKTVTTSEPVSHLPASKFSPKTTEDTISFEAYRPAFDIPREPTVSADPSLVPTVKAIAFYLPQFHPIPENDRWWGEGFTEWNNVRAGRPNFPGHYQPHVPTGLGYYDLRETHVLQKQTELAKAYGIYGFCFYYYWFGGKVLLDLPIRRMLESGKPDFPFCICWANENWTRRWDGREDEVLIAQTHSPEDDVNFIGQVENVLLQKNYIRVRGKPLLLVYRPSLLPDSLETTERWRDYFRRKGHGELHLGMVRSFYDQTAPEVYGFDAAVQFPPHFPAATITSLIAGRDEKFKGTIYDYTDLRRLALEQLITTSSTGKTYAAVMPSWDNTARRVSDAVIWANSSPEAYYEWLSAAVEQVQKKEESDERLIFINAWNEWAEGCHLEPDEKYGHAWLNATALALRPSTSLAEIHPEPPRIETIKVPALRDRLRLVISVLFYHREDLIERFLQSILRQILKAESRGDIECSLSLSFNYQPDAAVIAQIHQIIATTSHLRADAVYIIKNGCNVGFGAGHNMVFDKFDSDIFLVMNSDVRVIGEDWLVKLVDRFRGSDAVIVGLSQTASRLREDGCGIPIKGPEEEFDFVDGSALAIRSDLARRFGLFSPSYDYFYFEDADLCLRYRQMGLQIALLDAPYEHERSSSSRLLPQFAVENVLDRNRARLFEKWGKYLRTRTLSNRIGVRFLEIDRQLQCASLPALFGLLAEHSTAVIDLWGVHEQLGELFQHPRIRLIPSWQTLREDDYLRHYDLATNQAETPRVCDIANRMGCDPDFEGAKAHLESLIGSAYSENSKPSKTALLYVARKSPLFDGKEPNAESFAPVAKMLHEKNFSVHFYTDYGTFEVQNFDDYGTWNWKHVALCPGMELLEEIASADIIVTSDDWIAELGQLLQKRTFLWLGATSCRATIWDFERAGCFSDQSLSCLGCYHQFGRNRHNVCLRGDIACMRPQLAKDFVASLETFLGGEPLKAVAIHPNRLDLTSHRTMPSAELSLEHWPSSTANSVLVLTPVNPQLYARLAFCKGEVAELESRVASGENATDELANARATLAQLNERVQLDERVLERAKELAHRALKGMRNCRVVHDNCGEAPMRGQPHPHRQAAMASLRQHMVERYLQDERWIFWVDADIIDYPPFLIERLIQRAEGGIAAPLVLMEGEITEPVHKDGFGPGRFYDIAGFVENGRWARFTPPYFDQIGPVYELESVGSCYLVNADIYRWGGRHEIDVASSNFVSTNSRWSEDAIHRNQEAKANCFTEHYSLCAFARSAGLPVRAFGDLIAYHQKS
jgi:GT2 family glycosyltransferase